MKKFMLIPAIVLVFGLLVSSCDTDGDWSMVAFPLMPSDSKALIINNLGWKIPEPDMNWEGNLDITFDPAIDATGYGKLVIVYSSDADFDWWSGGDLKDDADKGHGWVGDVAKLWKGFWILTYPIHADSDKSAMEKVTISGGGPNANPGNDPDLIIAAWFE